jgi:hypothetical protein
MTDKALIEMEFDGHDCFVKFNGMKIAKRGQPHTEWAKQWISIEPGYRVLDGPNRKLIVEQWDTPMQ